MINVLRGKVYYKLETELTENYNVELANFLKEKGVKDEDVASLEFDFRKNAGKVLNFKVENSFRLTVKIHENKVVCLFETEMSSNEFYEFIGGFFS